MGSIVQCLDTTTNTFKARKAERNSLGVSLQNGGRRDHEGGLGSARGDRIPVPKTPWLILSQV
jgi:hypothetical protein